jgi:hypothetical protein
MSSEEIQSKDRHVIIKGIKEPSGSICEAIFACLKIEGGELAATKILEVTS